MRKRQGKGDVPDLFREPFDCCAFVKFIAERPEVVHKRLTQRHFILLRAHRQACWRCDSTLEAMARENPEKMFHRSESN